MMSEVGRENRNPLHVVRSSISPVWKKPANPISSPLLIDKWQYKQLNSEPGVRSSNPHSAGRVDEQLPCFYEKVVPRYN